MAPNAIPKTYGSLLIGGLCATFLSGMNTLQTLVYFRVYGRDSKLVKGLVGAVWMLDIIHTSFIWVSLWYYLVENFGDTSKFNVVQTPELIPGTIVLTSFLTLIVHMFYLHRIFQLSNRNYWIPTIIGVLAICRVASACGTSAELFRMKTWSAFGTKYKWLLSLGLILTCAVDVAIMIVMIVLLRLNRAKSLILNNVIDKLVLYSVEAGSLTACLVVTTLIAWYASPHTLIFVGSYLSVAKLYANSFMGSLNARHHLHNSGDSQNSYHWQGLSRVARLGNSLATEESAMEFQAQHIHVDVQRTVQDDEKSIPNVSTSS